MKKLWVIGALMALFFLAPTAFGQNAPVPDPKPPEKKYDRFEGTTTVVLDFFPVGSPTLNFGLFASIGDESKPPTILLGINLITIGPGESGKLNFLVNGERMKFPQPYSQKAEPMVTGATQTFYFYAISQEDLKRFADALVLEGRIGDREFSLNQTQIKAIRDFRKLFAPQEKAESPITSRSVGSPQLEFTYGQPGLNPEKVPQYVFREIQERNGDHSLSSSIEDYQGFLTDLGNDKEPDLFIWIKSKDRPPQFAICYSSKGLWYLGFLWSWSANSVRVGPTFTNGFRDITFFGAPSGGRNPRCTAYFNLKFYEPKEFAAVNDEDIIYFRGDEAWNGPSSFISKLADIKQAKEEAKTRPFQMKFSYEGKIEKPYPVPNSISRMILSKDRYQRKEDLVGSLCNLNNDGLPDFIVMGRSGANVGPFWVFRNTGEKWIPVFEGGGHTLTFGRTYTNGYRDIQTTSATAMAAFTTTFCFSLKSYRAIECTEEDFSSPNSSNRFVLCEGSD